MSTVRALVRLPNVLRSHVGGNSSVSAEGRTVGEVLFALTSTYPDLGPAILDDQGDVQKFINLYVNDEDIRSLDQLDTAVVDGDELAILPAVAGG